MIILAGLALIDTVSLPHGTQWSLPFMGYRLVLMRVDNLSYLMGVIFATITFLAVLYAAGFAKPWMHMFAMLYRGNLTRCCVRRRLDHPSNFLGTHGDNVGTTHLGSKG